MTVEGSCMRENIPFTKIGLSRIVPTGDRLPDFLIVFSVAY